MSEGARSEMWKPFDVELVGRSSADLTASLSYLEAAEAFSPQQFAFFRALLGHTQELEYRIVDLETRIAYFEIGDRPPPRLRNLQDLIVLVAKLAGVTPDKVRDRSPRDQAAIHARQLVCWFAMRRLDTPVRAIASALGRVSDEEIVRNERHYSLRFPAGSHFNDHLAEAVAAEWERSA